MPHNEFETRHPFLLAALAAVLQCMALEQRIVRSAAPGRRGAAGWCVHGLPITFAEGARGLPPLALAEVPSEASEQSRWLADLLPSFADEVHDPKYIVAVDLDGGGEASKGPADGHLTMTDRTGRRFRCELPANASAGEDAERGGPDRAGQARPHSFYVILLEPGRHSGVPGRHGRFRAPGRSAEARGEPAGGGRRQAAERAAGGAGRPVLLPRRGLVDL